MTSPPRPSQFTPFFTILSDTSSNETHHPHVHYIFQDDEPDILTSGILESLETSPDRKRRHIVIDLSADGRTVAAAKSLGAEWAVTRVGVEAAPTFGREEGSGSSGGLLLRLEGESRSDLNAGEGGEGDAKAKLEGVVRGAGGDLETALRRLAEEFGGQVDGFGPADLGSDVDVAGSGNGNGDENEAAGGEDVENTG